MARQGLMDDSGYDFFDASDCSNYESCTEEAYNDGYSDAIDEFADWVLINFAPLYTKEELINCFKEQLKEQKGD